MSHKHYHKETCCCYNPCQITPCAPVQPCGCGGIGYGGYGGVGGVGGFGSGLWIIIFIIIIFCLGDNNRRWC